MSAIEHTFSPELAFPFSRLSLLSYTNDVQCIPSSKVTPFSSDMGPFKRGGLSPGVEIKTLMLRFIFSSGLSGGEAPHQGGILKGVPL